MTSLSKLEIKCNCRSKHCDSKVILDEYDEEKYLFQYQEGNGFVRRIFLTKDDVKKLKDYLVPERKNHPNRKENKKLKTQIC